MLVKGYPNRISTAIYAQVRVLRTTPSCEGSCALGYCKCWPNRLPKLRLPKLRFITYGLSTLPNTPVWFGTNLIPAFDTSVNLARPTTIPRVRKTLRNPISCEDPHLRERPVFFLVHSFLYWKNEDNDSTVSIFQQCLQYIWKSRFRRFVF